MKSIPPRERVALGVAAVTVGLLILLLAPVPLLAFAGGLLMGAGVTVTLFALLRLRIEARDAAWRDRSR